MSFINSIFAFFQFNKKNWKAVVLSVFAATVFWCFNALNKNYSANITYPISFQYDETKYIPLEPLPEAVRVNVNGMGWDLFRKSVRLKIPPLVIPLEKPSEIRKIVGSTLPALFSSQTEGMQINFVLTDTLFISLDHRISRHVKLTLDSVQQFIESGFGTVGPISLSQDSILVEGPQSIVGRIPSVVSLRLPSNITESFDDEVEVLPELQDKIVIDPELVTVSFKVDPMTEIQEMVPVSIVNPPARLSVTSSTKKVSIRYHMPASLVQDLPGDSLFAELDLSKLGKGTHKLLPRVIGLPDKALLTHVDSIQVSF